MSKTPSWLSRLLGNSPDGVERRSGNPLEAAIRPEDIDAATGVVRSDRFFAVLEDEQARMPGALLVIDMESRVSQLMDVSQEDAAEALRLAAQAIGQAIRSDDIISHIEKYRFAVLLRGAPQALAGAIAQRICDSIDNTMFITRDHAITQFNVAVGGALFEPGSKDDLYRAALAKLESAQSTNTGRIALG